MFEYVVCCIWKLEVVFFFGCRGEFKVEYFVIFIWKGEEICLKFEVYGENVELVVIWLKYTYVFVRWM